MISKKTNRGVAKKLVSAPIRKRKKVEFNKQAMEDCKKALDVMNTNEWFDLLDKSGIDWEVFRERVLKHHEPLVNGDDRTAIQFFLRSRKESNRTGRKAAVEHVGKHANALVTYHALGLKFR